MLTRRSTRLTLFTGLILTVATVGLLWNQAGAASKPYESSDRFWRLLAFEGVEAEHYKSLDGMRVGAEVVVLGTITDVDSSREFGGVSDAEPVRLAALTVNVEEVLSGRLASNEASILLEVTLPGARSISELTSLMPRERAVFFLRNKGTEVSGWGWPPDRIEAERPFYRLASSQGLLREFDNVVRPPEGAEDDFLAALAGRPFGDVVQEVSRP